MVRWWWLLLGLLVVACHGAEPIVPPEPDVAEWAKRRQARSADDETPDDDTDEDDEDDETSTACSRPSGSSVAWLITNARSASITLWWVGFDCNESRYATIDPGVTYNQPTYSGHVWRVRDDASNELLDEVVMTADATQTTEVQ